MQINLNWLTYKLRFLHTALPVTKLKWNRLQVVHPANDNTLRQHPSSSVLFWTSREIFLFNLIVAGEQVGLTFRFTNRLRPNIGQTEQSEVNEFQMRYKKSKGVSQDRPVRMTNRSGTFVNGEARFGAFGLSRANEGGHVPKRTDKRFRAIGKECIKFLRFNSSFVTFLSFQLNDNCDIKLSKIRNLPECSVCSSYMKFLSSDVWLQRMFSTKVCSFLKRIIFYVIRTLFEMLIQFLLF